MPLPINHLLESKKRVYKIRSVLGQGSFGKTYLVTSIITIDNIETEMNFAIKEHFLAASCYRDDDNVTVRSVPGAVDDFNASLGDFLNEAKRLQIICRKNRNIVKVNETFKTNSTAYYVMEYLNGGSIRQCGEAEAIDIVLQIGNALKEIHASNLLHLDVKPSNIILHTSESGDTYPVLIDFGISKRFDKKGNPTSNLNARGASPGYAPQEQYGGIDKFSPKYDIYALGGVLFFLITGENPPDAFKISPSQIELKRELEGKASEKVIRTILNAMKPNAEERTPSIDRFFDGLKDIDFTPVLNVNETTLNFTKDKDTKFLRVDSNIHWKVISPDKNWCEVSQIGDQIKISVKKNKETGNRNCKIIIISHAYGINRTVFISQEGEGTLVLPHDKIISGGSFFKNFPNLSGWLASHKKIIGFYFAGIVIGACIILAFSQIPNKDNQDKNITGELTMETAEEVFPEEIVVAEPPYYDNEKLSSPLGEALYTGPTVEKDGIFVPHGRGKAEIIDGKYKGDVYEGEFNNGIMEGEAVYSKTNGDVFRGIFKENAFYEGTYTVKANGEYFEGKFKEKQPYSGAWYNKNGKLLEKIQIWEER